MKMGFKNIFDADAVSQGFVNIGLYFAKGIYYNAFPVAFNIVSALCQATGINLFNQHINEFYMSLSMQQISFSVAG